LKELLRAKYLEIWREYKFKHKEYANIYDCDETVCNHVLNEFFEDLITNGNKNIMIYIKSKIHKN